MSVGQNINSPDGTPVFCFSLCHVVEWREGQAKFREMFHHCSKLFLEGGSLEYERSSYSSSSSFFKTWCAPLLSGGHILVFMTDRAEMER